MSEHDEGGRSAPTGNRKIHETSSGIDKRRFPRYPASGVWSEPERSEHRQQRDGIIRDAGLKPDAGPPDDRD